MENCVEKIYCCDRGDNDNALAAAILANRRRDNDGWPMAAMMGGGMNNLINERFNRLGNCGCDWNNNCGCGNGCGR